MKNIILILFAFCLLISCNKDDDGQCVKYTETSFVDVNAPTTIVGAINENIIIEVEVAVVDSCSEFSKFIESVSSNKITIGVQVKNNTCIDIACTASTETRTVDYTFTAQTTGNYILKFKSSETEFITVNITIE